MFCIKCGKQIKDGSKFCKYCGAKVTVKVVTREEAQQGAGDAGTGSAGTAPGAAGGTTAGTSAGSGGAGRTSGKSENSGQAAGGSAAGGSAASFGQNSKQAGGSAPKSAGARAQKGPGRGDEEKNNSPQGNGRKAVIAVAVLAAALVLVVVLVFAFVPEQSLAFLSSFNIASAWSEQTDGEEEEAGEEDEEETAAQEDETLSEEETGEDGEEESSEGEEEEESGEGEDDKDDASEGEEDEEENEEDEVESTPYNPFDHIEVTFSGISPDGTASIQLVEEEDGEEDDIAEYLLFSIDVSEGLSNGDTVTVSVSNNEEAFLESEGVILTPLEQEYTVEGLSWYISSIDEVQDEDLELMKDKVESQFEQHVAEGWITRLWSARAFDYIGTCLLTPKTGEGNILYLIYQVNAECFEETGTGFSDQLFTYYYYARTEDVLADGDGSIAVSDLDFVMPTDTYNLYSTYNVYGYKTLDQMYNVILTSGYDYEKVVNDRNFGYSPVKMDTIDEVPDDAVAYNGHYYKMYGVENMTWTQAKEQCEIRGGHLATITSAEEWAAISVYVFGDSGADVWIGGYYSGGAWQWVTGETMSEIGWTNGVPDASDSSAYAYLGTSSWRWRNFTLDGIHADNYTVGYICEWE